MSKKIGLLIPTTSKNRNWTNIKQTYLFDLTFKTALLTSDPSHNYVFYIGIDQDDMIFSKVDEQKQMLRFKLAFKNIDIKFIVMEGIQKGHLTKMWNILFKQAYDEDCDYFFQCGDDINFKTKGWISDCIETLKKNNDIGLTGPINNNPNILTQAFVSRKHMDIFGWFFPEEIINWGCDDWYNHVYKPDNFFPLFHHFCSNDGGPPRYVVNNDKDFFGSMNTNYDQNVRILRDNANNLASIHKLLIKNYIETYK